MHLDPCIVATALSGVIPALLAQAVGKSSPGHEDFMAAIGAFPATVAVLLYCREKGRSLLVTISAFFVCGALGVMVPGAWLWTQYPEFAASCRWNVWAVLGFLTALIAHFGVSAVLAWIDRYFPGLLKKGINANLPAFLRDPENHTKTKEQGE